MIYSKVTTKILLLIGLFPVSPRSSGLNVKISKFWMIYSMCIFTLFISMFSLGLIFSYKKFNSSFWQNVSLTLATLSTAHDISLCFCSLYSLWIAINRATEKIYILEKLREIDFRLGIKQMSTGLSLIHFLLFHICLVFITNQVLFPGVTIDNLIQLGIVIKACALMELIELVMSIKKRFQLVNERLVEIVTRRISTMGLWTLDLPSVEVVSTRFSATLTIMDINLIHWKLCKVVQHVNFVFGSSFVFIMVNFFCQFIFNSYYLLNLLTDPEISFSSLVVILNWLSIHILQFYTFIWPFSLAVDEAHKTASVASRLLADRKDKFIITELHELASQLLNRNVEFSACDLFVLKVPVTISIASAVTTYLAIIVQLQVNSDTPESSTVGVLLMVQNSSTGINVSSPS